MIRYLPVLRSVSRLCDRPVLRSVRFWPKTAVKKPKPNRTDRLHHYFLLLNDDKKAFRMYKVGHRMNSFSFKPLFNYPSFIKTLNTYQLEFHVVNWLKS